MSEYDSYPILWFLVLRVWSFFGLGFSDSELRALGLIVGVGILLVIWWSTRQFGCRAPLISLLLFGFNAFTIQIGDSLRGYGLGILLMLFMLGATWNLVRDPCWTNLFTVSLAGLMSIHSLYYNSILLFGLCIGGVTVFLFRAQRIAALRLGVMGILLAFTMLPYIEIIRRVQGWNILFKVPLNMAWIALKVNETLSAPSYILTWIWLLLIGIAMTVCVKRVCFSGSKENQLLVEFEWFIVISTGVGTISYFSFIRLLRYPTEPWYYLPLMAFLAVIVDATFHWTLKQRTQWRVIRLVLLLVVGILISGGLWRAVQVRRTNLDLIAVKLTEVAAYNDLIVVNPWWPGITFQRYFKGSAQWVSLPDIDDHQVCRYDLLKKKIVQQDPIAPVLKRIERTLKSGHKVWLVWDLRFPSPVQDLETIKSVISPPEGWNEAPYVRYWSQQAAESIRSHARMILRINVPVNEPVNKHENLSLILAEGWI